MFLSVVFHDIEPESACLFKTMEKLLICYASSDFNFIPFSTNAKKKYMFSAYLKILLFILPLGCSTLSANFIAKPTNTITASLHRGNQ